MYYTNVVFVYKGSKIIIAVILQHGLHIYFKPGCPISHNLPLYLPYISLSLFLSLQMCPSYTETHIHAYIYIYSPFTLKGNKRTSTCQTFITAQFVSCPLRPCKQRYCSSHNPPSSLSLSTGTIMKRQCYTTKYLFRSGTVVSLCVQCF